MGTKKILTSPVIPFTAGKTERSDKLPQEFIELGVLLRMNLTADTPATAPVYRDEAPWNLIRELRVKKDGDTIIGISGETLFFWNWLLRGQNNPHTKPTGVSAADAELKAWYFLPFKSMRTGSPEKTYIDSSRISNWHIEVDWGDGATLASSNVPTDIKGNLELRMLGFLGGTTLFGRTFNDPIILNIQRNFAAATKTRIELNRSYRHRMSIIRVSDESTGHILSDTKLNSVRVIQLNTVEVQNLQYDDQAAFQAFENNITEDYDGGTPVNNESEAEGYLAISYIEREIDDSLDGAGVIELEVDVDAATRLDITQIMYRKTATA